MGLREQIRKANSESEITTLLSKGNSFEMASSLTRRSWKSTARLRLNELLSPSSKSTEDSTELKKIKTKKKKT